MRSLSGITSARARSSARCSIRSRFARCSRSSGSHLFAHFANALRDGEVVLGLGSAGSNRIRSASTPVFSRKLFRYRTGFRNPRAALQRRPRF